MSTPEKNITLLESLIPILALIVLLVLNVRYFGDDTLAGSNQIALLAAAGIAGLIAWRRKVSFAELEEGAVKSLSSAMPSVLILLMIGALAGSWLISGVIPALIYYGIKILNPTYFLLAACVVSALVSLATGSSWATIATLGAALLGIGKTLGWGEGIIAGAIISGAYFGDKMSPLSDTTNLAPAMAGTDLFTHIRYMSQTTGPSILITLVIFGIWGLSGGTPLDLAQVRSISSVLDEKFFISPILFVVPAVVIYMIIRKTPALPALSVGVLMGLIFALIFQRPLFSELAGSGLDSFQEAYTALMKGIFTEVSLVSGHPVVDELLTAGGMAGMLQTVWLIICAMIFGGFLEASGMLHCIGTNIVKLARSTGSLVASTAGTCLFFNITASDQYLAIVVPGRIFSKAYQDQKLKPEVLSRTLEDSGTVTSVLVPWNTCGATQSTVLGVATMQYLPYAFFNLISPFMTVLFAYLNIRIHRYSESELKEHEEKFE